MVPRDGVVFVDRSSTHGVEDLIAVDFRGAQVVHVWRDIRDLGTWRERPTALNRWPAGTFVVVVGSVGSAGPVGATRIEIPAANPVWPPSDTQHGMRPNRSRTTR
jgi:hypothetical protein